MKTDHESDTVFQALIDIKANLNETIALLNEQIRRAQLQHIENAFQQQKSLVAECLDGIDDQLIKLSVYVEEYQRLRASLRKLGEIKIPELGGTAPAMPHFIAGDTLPAILAERIDYLKSQGRI